MRAASTKQRKASHNSRKIFQCSKDSALTLATAVPAADVSSKLVLPPSFEETLNYRDFISRESTRSHQVTISHGSLMINSLMLHHFSSSGAHVTAAYLYQIRVAPSICFIFFPFLLIGHLFSGLNFLFLISSTWLMHEGKGPKMALCHAWSAGDLLSFPCKLSPGCPPLDLATSFSFGCSSPRGAVLQPGITQQPSGHPSRPCISPADPALSLEPNPPAPAGRERIKSTINPFSSGICRWVGQRRSTAFDMGRKNTSGRTSRTPGPGWPRPRLRSALWRSSQPPGGHLRSAP